MKSLRTISLSLVLICVFALGTVTAASIPEDSGRLQVTGNALITAAPDTAHIALGVETSGASVKNAVSENAERMASVLEALKSLGLESSAVSTSGYNIYSYSDAFSAGTIRPAATTYNVHNCITISTKNLDQVGRIVDAAVAAGANEVQNVTFDLADKEEMQLRALEIAIEQALGKADVMAKTAGETIGGIVSVHEEYGTYVAKNESLQVMGVGFDRGATTSINPGEVEVTAQVTMVFWF
ncbi:MAG TPA: hypothetical protein DDZ66_06775 [Firmicutes bacterium]|nr:hypothetical protein [Bacillota bacterium]